MTTPTPPWVQPQKFSFNNINSTGGFVIDANTIPFTGRLDDIFACNQSNGPVKFYLSAVDDSIAYPRITVDLGPGEQKGVWTGEIEYIMPGNLYFVYTDSPTNFITCVVSYIIYNELSGDYYKLEKSYIKNNLIEKGSPFQQYERFY